MRNLGWLLGGMCLAVLAAGLAYPAQPGVPGPGKITLPAAGIPPGVDVNRLLEEFTRGTGTPPPAVPQPAPRSKPPPEGMGAPSYNGRPVLGDRERFEKRVRETLWDGRRNPDREKKLLDQARKEFGLGEAEARRIIARVAREQRKRFEQAVADVDALRGGKGVLGPKGRELFVRKWTEAGLDKDEALQLLAHAEDRVQRLDAYRAAVETFLLEDGVISPSEERALAAQRRVIGLTLKEHQEIVEEIKEEKGEPLLDVLTEVREESRALALPDEDLDLYGRKLFSSSPDAFIPPPNLPPPDTYPVGPGDVFRVFLWGRIEETYDLAVDAEGKVQFPKIGPVRVGGLSYREARELLKSKAETITGVTAAVTLARVRPIQVFVVGEVERPGAVVLSPLSTVVHAVMAAGGPTSLGSLRTVTVRRRGLVKTTVDLYGFLLRGQAEGDLPLENGDVVVVPQARRLVRVLGYVKRPAVYELVEGEDLADAIRFAGGLRPDAYGGRIQVERAQDHERRIVLDLKRPKHLKGFALQDGDTVKVFPLAPELDNRVSLFGHVYQPGTYEWRPGLRASDVIGSAENLKPEVDLDYALILRETGQDRAKTVIPFRLGAALAGDDPAQDPELQPRDEIYVFSQEQFRPPMRAVARGEVRNPGRYRIEKGARVADLVRLAGGLAPDALTRRAELLRYLPDRRRQTIYVDLAAALNGDPAHNIELQDEDELVVHAVWDEEPKAVVFVEGEVRASKNAKARRGLSAQARFKAKIPPAKLRNGKPIPVLLTRGMTVRDLVFKAGGLTKDAYLPVAHLYRTDPRTKKVTIHVFDLGRAMEGDPEHDLVLQDLDHVVIHSAYEFRPVLPVTITGMVTVPGDYPHAANMRVRDLVLAAGGLRPEAYMAEAEVVRMEIKDDGEIAETRTLRFSLERAMAGDPQHNLLLEPYDKVLIKRIPEWRETWKVTIEGEVRFPGTYYISKGEKLSSVLRRAGGYTPEAYLRGAVFTRESARRRQQERLDELRDKLQQMILRASSQEVLAALSPEDVAAQKQYLAAQEQLLKKLGAARATGRVVIHLLPLDELEGSEWDIALENGDTLTIPQRPQTVSVVGAVYNPTSLLWEPDNPTVEYYLEKTGGPTPDAEEDEIYVVRADGTVVSARSLSEGSWWARDIRRLELYPGDTVLVPEKVMRISIMKGIKDITQILYQIAVTAGVAVALF